MGNSWSCRFVSRLRNLQSKHRHHNERAVSIPHQKIKQFCPQQIMCRNSDLHPCTGYIANTSTKSRKCTKCAGLCSHGFLLCCFNDASSFLQHPTHLISMMGAGCGRVPPLNGDPAPPNRPWSCGILKHNLTYLSVLRLAF